MPTWHSLFDYDQYGRPSYRRPDTSSLLADLISADISAAGQSVAPAPEPIAPELPPVQPASFPAPAPEPAGPSRADQAARFAQDVAYGHSDWERAGQALSGQGRFEEASGLRRTGAVLGGVGLGTLALASWIPGFNVFKPAQAARAARAFGTGASAGRAAGGSALRGGWDAASDLERSRVAAKRAKRAARRADQAPPQVTPILDEYRPMLADASQPSAAVRSSAQEKVFPIDPSDWSGSYSGARYDPSRSMFENLKTIQGSEAGAVRSRIISQNRSAFNALYQQLDEAGASLLQTPTSLDDLILRTYGGASGQLDIMVPRTRRMYSGAPAQPWDSDGVSYVVSLKGTPEVIGARSLQGRYIVPERGPDFVDPSFLPKITDQVDTSFREALLPDRIGESYSAAGAHLDMMSHFAPHITRNADNVLYYTQVPDNAMGFLSVGTMTSSADEAFEIAARRGHAYITDPSTGAKLRVPDEIANRYRGDLGPVAPNRFDYDNVLRLRQEFDNFDDLFYGSRGTGDQTLARIYELQGFNAPPRIVSVDQLEALRNEGLTPIYRGITDLLPTETNFVPAPGRSPEASLYYASQLLHGDTHFATVGSVGSGTYFTPAFARGSNYSEAHGVVVAGVIDPRARIMGPGEYHNLANRAGHIRRQLEEGFMLYDESLRWQSGSPSSDFFPDARSLEENFQIARKILADQGLENDPAAIIALASYRMPNASTNGHLGFSDPGRIAALLGYDGYLAPSTVYGYSKPEYVILNRKAMILADTGIEITENGARYTPTRLTPELAATPKEPTIVPKPGYPGIVG